MTDGVPSEGPQGAAPTRRRRAPNAPPTGTARGAEASRSTSSEIIRQRLRHDIVSMRLVPGTPILEKEIAKEHGVSRTPVREAVLRLAEERLVEVAPKSGTFVARIPLSALPEALVVRRALEGVTVRAATRFASASQLTGLRAIIQRQQETAAAGDREAFHAADEDFHAAIAAAGRYRGIWDLIQQVKVHVDRYRRLTLPQEGRMERVIAEHAAILAAIERGEAEVAVGHMEEHLNKLRSEIAEFRDMRPDFFIHDIELDEELLR
jgi:DNA-binding GntR family transcriptional regulator